MNRRPEQAQARYTGVAITLHWLVAALIFCGLALGMVMVGMKFSPTKLKFISWHKWIGITVLTLAVLRLLWRAAVSAPALPQSMARWQAVGARLSHALLYLLMFAVPITGWLFSSADGIPVVYLGFLTLPDLVSRDKGLAHVLKSVHHVLSWTLLAVIGLHVCAALKHHFVDRDDVLRRILPWRSQQSRTLLSSTADTTP